MDEHPTSTPVQLTGPQVRQDLQSLHTGSIGGGGVAMPPAMQLALQASFGTASGWQAALAAMLQAGPGHPGWALLVFQPGDGALQCQRTSGHAPEFAGGVPILALPTASPAGPAASSSMPAAAGEAWMAQIDWVAVHGRYQQAVQAAAAGLDAGLDEVGEALMLDVRRAGVYEQAATMIAGAQWRDPATVLEWIAALPAGCPVVLYCVHGHEVSQATTLRLRAAGLPARYLRGGLGAWQAAGRPCAAGPGGRTSS